MEPTPHDAVKLREFLEQRIGYLEKLIDQNDRAQSKALIIQAGEYQRRLEVLNHAHETAREKERDFLSREVFDGYVQSVNERLNRSELKLAGTADRDRLEATAKIIDARFEELSKRITETERAKANLDGRFTMLGIMLFGISTVINLALALATHFLR